MCKNKYLTLIPLCLMLVFMLLSYNTITVSINNEIVYLVPNPIKVNNEIMVPLNLITNYLNGAILYKSESRIKVVINGDELEYFVGYNHLLANKAKKPLSVAPFAIKDNIYVPLYSLIKLCKYNFYTQKDKNSLFINIKY